MYLIYNEKLDQFDEEVTEPVEIQNENSNLSITDTNKSENSFFEILFKLILRIIDGMLQIMLLVGGI